MRSGGSEKRVVILGGEPRRLGNAIELAEEFYGGNVFAKGFGDGEELFFDEEGSGAGIVEDVAEFCWSKTDVERKQNGAGFEHAVIGFEQAMAIAAEKRYAIAGFDPGLAQRAGKTADSFSHLRVGVAVVIADGGRAAGILLRRVTQETQWSEWNIHGLLCLNQAD